MVRARVTPRGRLTPASISLSAVPESDPHASREINHLCDLERALRYDAVQTVIIAYSPYKDERSDAWRNRRLYFECKVCHHAKTEPFYEDGQKEIRDCEACRSAGSFGPAKRWFRPPGFAHPIDREPVTRADELIESAYATRAKLVMQTPSDNKAWLEINGRIRAFPTRDFLLVSNSGPDGDGYHYCTACGRIESAKDPELNLFQAHERPFLSKETEPCPGITASRIVLGTDFVTDVSLFSLSLSPPFRLRPGNTETNVALRTVCEAVAKAACRMLEIEAGEILAEYRPALTQRGADGTDVEIFIYDTLSGGAGFSTQLAHRAAELFESALKVLAECPEGCDASCSRCLRSLRSWERGTSGRWHIHCAIELPSHFDAIVLERLIRDAWAKVEWGHGRILVRDGANAGWISYMLKDRQKSEFDGFADCIIIESLYNPIADA